MSGDLETKVRRLITVHLLFMKIYSCCYAFLSMPKFVSSKFGCIFIQQKLPKTEVGVARKN